MVFILEVIVDILTIQMSLALGNIIYILHTLPGAIMITTLVVLLEYMAIKKLLCDPHSVILRTVIRSVGSIVILIVAIIFKSKPIGIIETQHPIAVPVSD